jgi:hypothetical protein
MSCKKADFKNENAISKNSAKKVFNKKAFFLLRQLKKEAKQKCRNG